MNSAVRLVLLCSTLVFVFTACGGANVEDTGNVLRIGNQVEPESLDPHVVTGIAEHRILTALFEGLTRLDPQDLSVIPGVAESWEVSDDLLVYTFHLREDAKWSNGDPVTAHDFLYAWKRILTPSLASEYAYMLHPMKNAQAYNEGRIADFSKVGARAVDDHTLEVTLNNPTPYFLSIHQHYTWFPIHRPTIEKFGDIDDRNTEWVRVGNLVSNGPYVLSKWEVNNVIEVTRNPHYWDAGAVKLDGVQFYPIADENTEERKFRAGELDVTENVPLSKIDVYKRQNPDLLRMDPWIGSYYYRVNTTRPPFDDKRVRKALAMAIDRASITKNVTRAGESPAPYYTPPGINGYEPPEIVKFDPEAARKLLAEAGYPNGKNFPGVDIHYNILDKHKIIAVAIQQMWKEHLNIDVTLTNEEWKVYLATQSNLDYDVSRAGWIADVLDPINFLECFTTGNGNNRTGWSNAEYDGLVDEARRTNGQDARNKLYNEAESILLDELPVIPIYIYTRPFLISPRVKGLYPNLLAHVSYDKIWLESPGG